MGKEPKSHVSVGGVCDVSRGVFGLEGRGTVTCVTGIRGFPFITSISRKPGQEKREQVMKGKGPSLSDRPLV